MPYPIDQVTGIILAGGKSRRMGYHDKAFMAIQGQSLIAHTISLLIPQTTTLLVNANHNFSRYQWLGYPVIPDIIPNYSGPLVGIASALRQVKTKFALIVPCDCPCFPTTLGPQLMQHLPTTHTALSVVFDGERLQPLFMLTTPAIASHLMRYLKTANNASVKTWLKQQTYTTTQIISDHRNHYFININTPSDKQKFIHYLTDSTHDDI